MKLWLIGMMGSGKSSAGRMASEFLDVAFQDTDSLVAEQTGCSVAELWAQRGEEAFRAIEKSVMRDVAARSGIISTGGGVVLDPDNRALMLGPKVVWLQASPQVLAQRLEGTGDRPGLLNADQDEESYLAGMLAEREPIYDELATHRIDTEGIGVAAIAAMIEAIWRS